MITMEGQLGILGRCRRVKCCTTTSGFRGARPTPETFRVVDSVFVFIFLVELLLRIWFEKSNFLKDAPRSVAIACYRHVGLNTSWILILPPVVGLRVLKIVATIIAGGAWRFRRSSHNFWCSWSRCFLGEHYQ